MPHQPASRPKPYLAAWLAQFGITDNPFGINRAEREPMLSEYFIHTRYYDAIEQNESVVLLAAEGSGKTAHKIMMAQSCSPHDPASPRLAVDYAQFGSLPHQMLTAPDTVTLRVMLEQIIGAGTSALIDALMDRITPAHPFRYEWLFRLRWLCACFCPDALSLREVMDRLRRIAGDAFAHDLDWSKLAQSWEHGSPGSELRAQLEGQPVLTLPAVRWLIDLIDATPEALDCTDLTDSELFDVFVETVRTAGDFETVIVLIDKVDEQRAFADHRDLAAAFVAKALGDPVLMKHPHAAFKWFLPRDLKAPLEAHHAGQIGQVTVREIEWQPDMLRDLLNWRMLVFSGDNIQALSALCEEPLADTIEQEIVHYARNNPRRLLELAADLITRHGDRPDAEGLITQAAWDAIVGELNAAGILPPGDTQESDLPPPDLRLDHAREVVYVGAKKVVLSGALFEFLAYMAERTGRIVENRDLITEFGDYNNIRKLVSRLRHEIEPDAKAPIYLLTERGRGYTLVNVAQD